MIMQEMNASASPEVGVNENFETLEWAAVYGKRQPVTSALTWGYYGGRWGGFSISEGTLALTDSATNYVVVERATGIITVSTAATNWNNVGAYARVYKITTSGGLVTAVEDHRAGNGAGVHGGTTFGKHAVPVSAGAMKPSTTNGCAQIATVEISAGQPDVTSLDFDPSTQEYAQFSIPMPKSWNEGTLTFKPIWSHSATATNFGVVWSLQAVAVSNDDAIGVSFGTAQTSTDTGGTTDDLYVGPESSAITVGGSPAAEDIVFFRISRVVADGGDTLAVDARLHGIVLYVTTDAENDA